MPVRDQALTIVHDWYVELSADPSRGPDDPLFPATALVLDEAGCFAPAGLARYGWSTSAPMREIFRRAFPGMGLPYYNPHSFRDMLVRYAMSLGLPPEGIKAWSQNLGHAVVLTTFTSYGQVPEHRQGELIRAANAQLPVGDRKAEQVAALEALLVMMKGSKPVVPTGAGDR